MANKITPMNAKTLLEHLRNGAKLDARWSYGTRYNRLRLPSGDTLNVQRSNVSALIKTGHIHAILLSGDNEIYFLSDKELIM